MSRAKRITSRDFALEERDNGSINLGASTNFGRKHLQVLEWNRNPDAGYQGPIGRGDGLQRRVNALQRQVESLLRQVEDLNWNAETRRVTNV